MAIGMALGAKLGTVAVLTAVGVAGLVVPVSHSAATGANRVWIDAPLDAANVTVGSQTVYAHASATSTVSSLELIVDGTRVATDGQLTYNGKLAYGTLAWTATAGWHSLTVRDTGHNVDAGPIDVHVGAFPPPTATQTAPASSTPHATPTPTATSSSPSSTPTTSASTSRSSSSSHYSSPPHSSTPAHSSTAAPPTLSITSVSVTPTTAASCQVITVTAHVTGASAVTAYFGGQSYPMTASGTTWSVQFTWFSSPPPATQPVSVEAVHPGEKAVNKDTAPLSVQGCKP